MKVIFKVFLNNLSILLGGLLGWFCPNSCKRNLLLTSFYVKVKGYNDIESIPEHELVAVKRTLGFFTDSTYVVETLTEESLEKLIQWVRQYDGEKGKLHAYIDGQYISDYRKLELKPLNQHVEIIYDKTTSATFNLAIMWKDHIFRDYHYGGPILPTSKALWLIDFNKAIPPWLLYGRSSDIVDDSISLVKAINPSHYSEA